MPSREPFPPGRRLPTSLRDRNICIVGLGYVGMTLAVALADAGFRVHGLETNDSVLAMLRKGEPHFWEPRLKEKLERVTSAGAFTFSRELDPGFWPTVYIITVGTPLAADGSAYLGSVENAVNGFARTMQDGALVILRSTVTLGTARNVVAPILAATGRKFEIAVCPERTLEGRALIELNELPQIIGADDPDTRARCAAIFGILTPTTIPLSSLEAGEVTKLIDNTWRDVNFAFANEIARFCGNAGLSAREIIRAGRLGYPRNLVPQPGPVGGPCLEKDPHIFVQSARAFGVELPIAAAARSINEAQPSDTVRLMRLHADELEGFPEHPVISLLGLAFKGVPATDDLRGTMAKPILAALLRAFPGATFRGYDPVIASTVIRSAFDIDPAPSLEDAFTGANLVVIANNHTELQLMDIATLSQRMARPGLVYDYWNLHDGVQGAMTEGISYLPLGSERFQEGAPQQVPTSVSYLAVASKRIVAGGKA